MTRIPDGNTANESKLNVKLTEELIGEYRKHQRDNVGTSNSSTNDRIVYYKAA